MQFVRTQAYCAGLEEAGTEIDAVGQGKQGNQKPGGAKQDNLLQGVHRRERMNGVNQCLYDGGHDDPLLRTKSIGTEHA